MYRLIILFSLFVCSLLHSSEQAIVIGAGPTGLLTGIKLSEEGAKVTVIEKRSAAYSRMQIVTLDREWVTTLQTLNGPLFLKLIEDGHARYRPEGSLDIAINQLELALKYIAETLPNLTIKYQTEVVKIKQPKENGLPFRVKLSTGKEQCFDLLVFAAGANDALKDRFLDLSIPYSNPVTYTVSVWDKNERHYVREEKNHETGKSIDEHLLFLSLQQARLTEQLLEQNQLDDEVVNHGIELLCSIPSTQAIPYREYDNEHHLYVGIELPENRAALRNLLMSTIRQTEDPEEKAATASLVAFLDSMTALMIKEIWDLPESAFTLREKNSATFPLVQRSVLHPVKVVELRGSQAVFAAVGDDLVSPHFFSGSGLTSGRVSVENIAHAFRLWRDGKRPICSIVASLYQSQHEVINFALDNGRPYVPFLQPEAPIRERYAKRARRLKELSLERLQVEIDEYGDYTACVNEGLCQEGLNDWELAKLEKNASTH